MIDEDTEEQRGSEEQPSPSQHLVHSACFDHRSFHSTRNVLSRLSRIVFFDLDDTLIPTEWVRRAFLSMRPVRRGQHFFFKSWPSTGTSPLPDVSDIQKKQASLRQELQYLAGADFDEEVAALIEKSCKAFGVVVVVTNARSSAWLHVVSSLFPKLKAQLRRLSVPIIRAAAVTDRAHFSNAAEYFQHWATLKQIQFQRVVATTAAHFEMLRAGPLSCVSEPCSTQEEIRLTQATLGSPRAHEQESRELEDILLEWDSKQIPYANELLERLLRHQIRRCMLHHFAQGNPEIAQLPYNPHTLLSDDPFPPHSTLCYNHDSSGNTFMTPMLPKETSFIPHRLDIVCVGDSDFELFAARELAISVLPSHAITSCGLIKCRAGLHPGAFRTQLLNIEQALSFMVTCMHGSSSSGLRVFGKTVIAEHTTSRERFRTVSLGHHIGGMRHPLQRVSFWKPFTMDSVAASTVNSVMHAQEAVTPNVNNSSNNVFDSTCSHQEPLPAPSSFFPHLQRFSQGDTFFPNFKRFEDHHPETQTSTATLFNEKLTTQGCCPHYTRQNLITSGNSNGEAEYLFHNASTDEGRFSLNHFSFDPRLFRYHTPNNTTLSHQICVPNGERSGLASQVAIETVGNVIDSNTTSRQLPPKTESQHTPPIHYPTTALFEAKAHSVTPTTKQIEDVCQRERNPITASCIVQNHPPENQG